MDIKEMLQEFHPYNEQEIADKSIMFEYLHRFDNLYLRENHFGHITCSAWIINADCSKVLMIYHNIYNSWGWSGGHSDGEKKLLNKAKEEGLEETGLKSMTAIGDKPLSLEILPVHSHTKHGRFVSAHMHLNFTYLFIADESEPLHVKSDENQGVRWIDVNEIDDWVSEEYMKPIYHKLLEKANYQLVALRKGI